MRRELLVPREVLRVADETWIALALLHREHPEREDFTVKEIIERARRENMAGGLRPGVGHHASFHAVANKEPKPSQLRMLYDTGSGRRRLYREGDPAHPKRKGKILPEADAIPARYRQLLEWYRNEYARPQDAWLQGLRELAGAGKEIFSGIDADEYVRQLREGWE